MRGFRVQLYEFARRSRSQLSYPQFISFLKGGYILDRILEHINGSDKIDITLIPIQMEAKHETEESAVDEVLQRETIPPA